MLAYVVGVYVVCVWLHLKNVVASFFMVCDFLCEIACLNFLLDCGLSVESVIFPLGL